MAREIRIEHPDGSTDTLTHLSSQEEYDFGKEDQASMFTLRSEVNAISLSEDEDEVYFVEDGVDQFGGLLGSIVRKGSEVELVVDSFEEYARDAEPTPGGDVYENAQDDTVITDAIDNVSQLSVGTVNNINSGLTFVFSHSSQANKIREVESTTPGEIRYNPDKTVDYVSNLGSDKTATTLSPSSQNIVGDIEVERTGREQEITHLRVVGAGEGKHQQTATAISSSYSSGDRKKWRTYPAKSATKESTLQSIADTRIQELNAEHIEVDLSIKGVDVSLGDELHVEYPEENVNHDLRIVELKTITDSKGVRHSAILSSRQKTRTDPRSKQSEDVSNYNIGFEGSPVTMNTGGGRQPVNSQNNYEFDFYYPSEVEYEHRVNLFVKGLSYRAYSSGAASGGGAFVTSESGGQNDDTTQSGGGEFLTSGGGGGFSETTTSNAQSEHGSPDSDSDTGFTSLVGSSSWVQIAQPVVSEFEVEGMFGGAFARNIDPFEDDIRFRINVGSGSSYWPSENGARLAAAAAQDSNDDPIPATGSATAFAPVEDGSYELEILYDGTSGEASVAWWYTALGDHSHEVTVSRPDHEHSVDIPGHQHTFDWLHEHTVDVPSHSHQPDPGIIETGDYPTNSDVLVNGQSVGVSIGDGSGPFEQQVSLAGELNPGQVNTIEITSETLGHIQAHLDIDVYRQILGDG